jgi:hypothetical protein
MYSRMQPGDIIILLTVLVCRVLHFGNNSAIFGLEPREKDRSVWGGLLLWNVTWRWSRDALCSFHPRIPVPHLTRKLIGEKITMTAAIFKARQGQNASVTNNLFMCERFARHAFIKPTEGIIFCSIICFVIGSVHSCRTGLKSCLSGTTYQTRIKWVYMATDVIKANF